MKIALALALVLCLSAAIGIASAAGKNLDGGGSWGSKDDVFSDESLVKPSRDIKAPEFVDRPVGGATVTGETKPGYDPSFSTRRLLKESEAQFVDSAHGEAMNTRSLQHHHCGCSGCHCPTPTPSPPDYRR